MEIYKVTEKDLIGDLAGMPIEIVQFMVDEQIRQGNKADVSIFQKNMDEMCYKGGIDWDSCEFFNENEMSSILLEGEYSIFFKKFPKKEEELPLPRKVLVWYSDEEDAVERELLHVFPESLNLTYRFIVRRVNYPTETASYRHMKELLPAKKMTKEEIEKELGYKIEIV